MAQHIVEVAKDAEGGIFSGTDEVIEEIIGQKPMDLETFVKNHRDAFER
jgi:NAD(P)H dehydrogenase (quinone)